MWIEKTASGLRLCDRYKGIDGKIHKASVTLPKDTPQARRKAQIELAEKISINSTNASRITLKSLTEHYLSKKDIKESTRGNYECEFNQLLEILGDVQISELSAPYIRRKLSESKKSASTLNRYITVLNTFLSWMYDFGYCSEPMHISKLRDKETKRDPSEEYLEPSELSEVLEQLEGTMAYYVCKFMVLTGCRIGETIALRLSDVDDRYIHINKTYQVKYGESTPKTATSMRDIYIQPELRAFLNEYRKWRNMYIMANGIRTDLLFFSTIGTHFNIVGFRRRLDALNTTKHIHPHIFRHTHVSLLAEQGLSLEAIARRLGHSNSKITREIYFHVTERMKEKDERALDKISIF